MYSVTKVINFCYGHRLLNYEGKCRYLHGHNGTVEIELGSERLDQRGMVRDFGEIKRVIQTWIDRELDHKMLLCQEDPLLPLLQRSGEPIFGMDANPTAEAIAELIFTFAASQRLPVTMVRLWETDSSVAVYSLDSRQTSAKALARDAIRARSTHGGGRQPGASAPAARSQRPRARSRAARAS